MNNSLSNETETISNNSNSYWDILNKTSENKLHEGFNFDKNYKNTKTFVIF